MSENSAPSSNDKIGPAIFVFRKFYRHHGRPLFPLRTGVTISIKLCSIDSDDPLLLPSFATSFRINGYEIMASLKDAGKEGKRRKNKGNWSGDHSTDLVIPIHASEITRVNYSWQGIIILVSWIDPTRNRIVIVREIF